MVSDASFATRHNESKGRLVQEAGSKTRTPFQRDRDRIIHSSAFRRLEYKTQVFINHEGDHYRTRLTHSLEVAQLARGLCRQLGLDEDLGEAVALSHDLGHPPFGHAGEYGLRDVMQPYGGFDHNAQSLRIVTELEQRYAAFDGLNLTWETLEGMAKHNGPLTDDPADLSNIDITLAGCIKRHTLEPSRYAGPEAQAAALADDVAYHNHDIEDGVRAGFFSLNDLRFVPEIAAIIDKVDGQYPVLQQRRRVHEVLRRLIHLMVCDVVAQTRRNIDKYAPETVEDVRNMSVPLINFSEAMLTVNQSLKSFLMERMYRHYRVNRMTSKAKRVVGELFGFFFNQPECLPPHWRAAATQDDTQRARLVCDYIAGMTDRYALDEHKRIFDVWARP